MSPIAYLVVEDTTQMAPAGATVAEANRIAATPGPATFHVYRATPTAPYPVRMAGPYGGIVSAWGKAETMARQEGEALQQTCPEWVQQRYLPSGMDAGRLTWVVSSPYS